MTRLERLQATLERPLLVTSEANVRYLTGFRGIAALLVDPQRVRLLTDSRFTGEARTLTGLEVVEVERGLSKGIGARREGIGSIGCRSRLVMWLSRPGAGAVGVMPSSGMGDA